jgi:hypothetical protein
MDWTTPEPKLTARLTKLEATTTAALGKQRTREARAALLVEAEGAFDEIVGSLQKKFDDRYPWPGLLKEPAQLEAFHDELFGRLRDAWSARLRAWQADADVSDPLLAEARLPWFGRRRVTAAELGLDELPQEIVRGFAAGATFEIAGLGTFKAGKAVRKGGPPSWSLDLHEAVNDAVKGRTPASGPWAALATAVADLGGFVDAAPAGVFWAEAKNTVKMKHPLTGAPLVIPGVVVTHFRASR